MIIPVRCFTCGKVLGNKWETYTTLCLQTSRKEALDQLGLTRFCCRSILLTHKEMVGELMHHGAAMGSEKEKEERKSIEKRILTAR